MAPLIVICIVIALAAGGYLIVRNRTISSEESKKDSSGDSSKETVVEQKAESEQSDANNEPQKKASVENSSDVLIDQSDTTYNMPRGMFNWEEWVASGIFQNKYFTNVRIDKMIKLIQERVTNGEQNSATRILGFGGLGKTRLVYEAIKGIADEIGNFIYCNTFHHDQSIPHAIVDKINEGDVILVVDNCDLRLHEELMKLTIHHTNVIHLVTITHEVGERFSGGFNISLVAKDFENIIPEIIKDKYPNLLDADVQKISEFSQGFPYMAVEIARAKLDNEPNLGELSNDVLLGKLLGDITADEKKVLMACSVFSSVGRFEDVKGQLEFIAKNSLISGLRGTEEDKLLVFKEAVKKFERRKIIERVGRFIQVRPKPLAVRLSAEWWRNTELAEMEESFLSDVNSHGLSSALCKQMETLSFLPEAQDFVKDMCGVAGPFYNAKVLNTSDGSRIFRSFALVNHHVTTDTLYNLYINKSIDELKEVDRGRRNLVWALEYLCGKKDTFDKASKVLSLLAAAENEHISNNATGQFIHLFSIQLPGTEATLLERIDILKYAVSHSDMRVRVIGLKAMARGLYAPNRFYRMASPGEQNIGIKIEDYFPQTIDEIKVYWKGILDLLVELVNQDSQYLSEVKEVIGDCIRGVFIYKADKIILDAIQKLKTSDELWRTALGNTLNTFEFEAYKRKESELVYLHDLLKILMPQTFEDYYKIGVADPIQSLYLLHNPLERKEDYNERDLVVKEYYRKWAETLISEYEDSQVDLSLLFKGKQNSGYGFGVQLGKVLIEKYTDGSERLEFLSKCIEAIESISKEEQNVLILGSMLDSFDETEFKHAVFDIIEQKDVNYHQVIFFAKFVHLPLSKLKALVEKYSEEEHFLHYFDGFAYGNNLDHLTIAEKVEFCQSLANYNKEGAWVAIHILERYIEYDDNFSNYRRQVIEMLMVDGVIAEIHENNSIAATYVIKWVRKLLEDKSNLDFVNFTVGEIIKVVGNDKTPFINSNIETLLNLLIENYFDLIFPPLGDLLSNYLVFIKLRSIIGVRSSFYYSEGILFLDDGRADKLYQWCEEKPNKRFPIIAELMPTEVQDENGNSIWHPFARKVLDNYGSVDGVLRRLSANLGTYGSVGTSLGYLSGKLKLMEALQQHSNSEVQEWAVKLIAHYKTEIQREKNFQQERNL